MNKNLQRILLVFSLVSLFAASAVAQVSEVKADDEKYNAEGTVPMPSDNGVNKADYENWKFPVDAVLTVGTSINRYVSFLFQDSSVVWVPDPSGGGSQFHYNWHSVGAAFDPTDVNLEVVDDGIRLDRWHGYTVDSLFFPYLYVRYVDSFDFGSGNEEIVDTLIIEFFTYQQLEFRSFTPTGGEPEIFAKPSTWSPGQLGSPTQAYQIKIPLTSADSTPVPTSTGWGSRGRTIAIPNIAIPQDEANQGNRVCGFSIAFKTMVPYQFGDTMETRDGSVPTKRLNYFGHNMYLNEGTEVVQTEYWNNSWWVPSEIAYGGTLNGWANSIPGNAYFDDRYISYAIHVTNATIGYGEPLGENVTISVYPNPVSRSQTLMLDFELVNAEDVQIEIYDMMGNLVKTVADGYYTAGTHLVDVDITDLPAGIYLYKVQAGDASTTKKITVTE